MSYHGTAVFITRRVTSDACAVSHLVPNANAHPCRTYFFDERNGWLCCPRPWPERRRALRPCDAGGHRHSRKSRLGRLISHRRGGGVYAYRR